MQQEINTQARADIDRSQREFYLVSRLKAIRPSWARLMNGEEIAQFREKIDAAKMPKRPKKKRCATLKKLDRII